MVSFTDMKTSAGARFDIVVFGATGFTGRLVAEYLARKMKHQPLRWAIAGRNIAKLEDVKKGLLAMDPACAGVEIIVASVDDPDSLARMAARTRVLITTVGPYATFGEPVVSACVSEGASYVDLTGEPEFVRRTIERFDDAARAKGLAS